MKVEDIEHRVNKYALWLHDFRIVPRVLTIGYSYLVWDMVHWFISLEQPTTQQTAFVSTIVGISAAVFGFYTNSTSGLKK